MAKLQITDNNDHQVVVELNDSQAAKDLIAQQPSTVKLSNYAGDEKMFYPEQELSTAATPHADAKVDTLGYYAPWGDVCLFYRNFGRDSGLYELGTTVSGQDQITKLTGMAKLTVLA